MVVKQNCLYPLCHSDNHTDNIYHICHQKENKKKASGAYQRAGTQEKRRTQPSQITILHQHHTRVAYTAYCHFCSFGRNQIIGYP